MAGNLYSQRQKEVAMRKTLLVASALVLVGATAAIGAVGPGVEADLVLDRIQVQDCDPDCDGTPDRDRLELRLQDGSCQLDEASLHAATTDLATPAGDQTETQTRTQARVQDGDCDQDCPGTQTQTETQTRTQARVQDGDCDQDCPGTQTQVQEQEQAGEPGRHGEGAGGTGGQGGNGK